MNILDNELVQKYFGDSVPDDYGDMAMRILQAMQEPIKKGERSLVFSGNSFYEVEATEDREPYGEFHPQQLRLPSEFQPKDEKKESCCEYAEMKWPLETRSGRVIEMCEKCFEASKHKPAEKKECGMRTKCEECMEILQHKNPTAHKPAEAKCTCHPQCGAHHPTCAIFRKPQSDEVEEKIQEIVNLVNSTPVGWSGVLRYELKQLVTLARKSR